MEAELIRYEEILKNPEKYLKEDGQYWEFSQKPEECKDVNDCEVTRVYFENSRFHVVQGCYSGTKKRCFCTETDYTWRFSSDEMKQHKHFQSLKGKNGKLAKNVPKPF